MRIISWNIRQGGGRRIDGIVGALLEHDADVIGLAECLPNINLVKLRKVMEDKGWVYQSFMGQEKRQYSLLLISRLPFTTSKTQASYPFIKARWGALMVEKSPPRILFAHVPDFIKPKLGMSNKEIFWQNLAEYAKQNLEEPTLILGDLNTGLPVDGPGFRCVKYFQELLDLGYQDMWREYHPGSTEFTWHSRSNGFRLDHAFASPAMLPLIQGVFYSHREREEGVSDHSLLIADITLSRP